MINQTRLIEILNEMLVHPIIKEVLTDEIKSGEITTEKQLKYKAQEYEDDL